MASIYFGRGCPRGQLFSERMSVDDVLPSVLRPADMSRPLRRQTSARLCIIGIVLSFHLGLLLLITSPVASTRRRFRFSDVCRICYYIHQGLRVGAATASVALLRRVEARANLQICADDQHTSNLRSCNVRV